MAATTGGIIAAAFFHVLLMIFGAANAGFEATYRVMAFGTGSVYMLLAIPLVGPLFAIVMQPIVLIYGLMYAHETSGGKALAAVLLPMLLALCCLGIMFLPLLASLPHFPPPGQ